MSTLSPKPFIVIAGPCVLEADEGAVAESIAETLASVVQNLSEPVDFYFKASFDKANRSSVDAYRGPGLEKGLSLLARIGKNVGVKLLTDIHTDEQAAPTAEVVDMLQIPAFLSRQTDLLVAAGKTGKAVNLKKGQFLSPKDVVHAADKIRSTGNMNVNITERGASFGYNNLVVDMRSIPIIQSFGLPLIFDATHSVQLPGGAGKSSGGERQYAPVLARAAVAAGADGLFFETHPNPDRSPSDGANMIPLTEVAEMLSTCLRLRQALRAETPALR